MSGSNPKNLFGFDVCDDGTLLVSVEKVREEWLDHNGHMNVAAYLTAFDAAVCIFCTALGIGPDQIPQTNKTIFVGQANIVYRHELVRGGSVRINVQLLGLTGERAHACLSMYDDDKNVLAALNEQLFICVDLVTRRPAPLPPVARQRFQTVVDAQRHLPVPKYVGRQISLDRNTGGGDAA
ncbi:acyl-CoA thioesterase [Oricola nitratireducens]|uniref:acyl-CoA thioesterase n=1 Tax=Oricola nitratireducens TaxID=2775868 RepID=UPI001865FD77|nr:thioesterase family protein [Oricola nitratireducens]